MDRMVLIVLVAIAALVILIVAIVGSMVLIEILVNSSSSPEKHAMINQSKVSCLITYEDNESDCKANTSNLGDFGENKWNIGCCWNADDMVCSAKEYPNGIPAQLENC